jgi:hypothetical protein
MTTSKFSDFGFGTNWNRGYYKKHRSTQHNDSQYNGLSVQ